MKRFFPILIAIATAASVMILVLGGCNVSTAGLSNVKLCEKLDGDACSSDMSTLSKEASTFFVTANLDNAPAGTKIKIDWRYLSGELGNQPQDIDSASFTSEEDSNVITGSLERATATWPKGEYEVVLKIQTDNADPVSKTFSVK